MSEIKISVITVVYNGAETIEKAIESVISQDYSNFEYIIVDGGSNDGTQEIIKCYEDKIEKWISEEDQGIYHAMNKGIGMASGDLIGFLSSNDWYDEGAISAIAHKYVETGADVIYGDVTVIDGDDICRKDYGHVDLEEFCYVMPVIHPGIFVKTIIQKKYGFDQSYRSAADAKFFMQVYRAGYRFEYLNTNIVFYNLGGMSSNYLIDRTELLRASREVLGDDFERYKQKAYAYYYYGLFRGMIKEERFKNFAISYAESKYYETAYIYGAGEKSKAAVAYLEGMEVEINGIFDANENKIGKMHDRWMIMPLAKMSEIHDCILLISSTKYTEEMKVVAKDRIKDSNVEVVDLLTMATDVVVGYLNEVNKKELLIQD